MDRNLDWLVPALRKLGELQQAPGRKYTRKYKKPIETITSFVRRLDGAEVPAVFEFILGHIADHLRAGGPMSTGFKQLADACAQHIYAVRNLEVIRKHFFWQDTRYDLEAARAEALFVMAFFKHVGETTERSVDFCRMLLDEHAHWDETFVKNGRQNSQLDAYDCMPWLRTIMIAASSPVAVFMPQKWWLENIITAARDHDPEAQRCVRGIFELIRLIWEQVTVMSQTTYELMYGLPDATFRLDIPDDIRNFHLTLILSDANADWSAKQMQRTQQAVEQLAMKADDFIDWVLAHNHALGRSFNQKVEEMLHRPRYGLIKGGYDSVMVKLSPLQVTALTSFSFFPDNGSLDDLRVQFNRRTLGDRLCQFMLGFRDFSLVQPEMLFPAILGQRAQILTSILEYAVVDAMHSIICREPRKNEAGDDVPREKKRADRSPRREVIVRPFLRRLPLGHEASDAARDRALLELGWYLPEGVTFVQSHERYAGLPSQKPPPLFTYTDERFKQSIEED